ncbi:thioester reductase, partial [Clostridium perfringens]
FLYRMTHDTDLLIGVNNEKGNLLPLRVNLSGSDSFAQIYEQVFAKMEQIEGSSFSLEDIEGFTGQSLTLQTVYGSNGKGYAYSSSGLNWMVQEEKKDEWTLYVSYARPLYKEKTIEKFSRHFELLACAALEHADMPVSRLPMLTDEDRNAYTILNDTKQELPEDPTIVSMLASIVKKFPERIALSSNHEQVTYEQLDRLSNQISHMLLD